MLEYSSLLLHVSVSHVKLTGLPKFVENLESMEVVNIAALKYSDFGHESCCKEGIILANIEANMTKEYIDFISTENFTRTPQSL